MVLNLEHKKLPPYAKKAMTKFPPCCVLQCRCSLKACKIPLHVVKSLSFIMRKQWRAHAGLDLPWTQPTHWFMPPHAWLFAKILWFPLLWQWEACAVANLIRSRLYVVGIFLLLLWKSGGVFIKTWFFTVFRAPHRHLPQWWVGEWGRGVEGGQPLVQLLLRKMSTNVNVGKGGRLLGHVAGEQQWDVLTIRRSELQQLLRSAGACQAASKRKY